jgi:3-oxoacyl-[acyl-carrier protein] reductase
MLDLIIISGASKGIGNNIANDLSNYCNNLIGISSSNKIKEIKLSNNNCNYYPIQIDLTDYNVVQSALEQSLSFYKLANIKRIGIILCGAMLGQHGGLLNNLCDLETWDKQFKCNVLGNLAIIKAYQKLIETGSKLRIVFFAGGGAAYGYPDFSGYALSKVAVVRAVENISLEFKSLNYDASIIALAPGAVETDIFKEVVAHGGFIKTKTDISEPTNFVRKFLLDEFNSKKLNGRFLHVRDDIENLDIENDDMLKLRRIQ